VNPRRDVDIDELVRTTTYAAAVLAPALLLGLWLARPAESRFLPRRDRAVSAYLGARSGAVTEVVRGFKGAELVLRGTTVVLRGLGTPVTYGVEALSGCMGADSSPPHASEDITGCTCGFHGFTSFDAADTHTQHTPSSVVLSVVASGMVVVHRLGYRSSRQRVTGVTLRRCRQEGCAAAPALLEVVPAPRDSLLSPVCQAHFTPGAASLSASELTEQLSLQVPDRARVVVST
jgi:hypothetical protein